MDALVTKEELPCTSLLSRNASTNPVEAIRLAAIRARDEALAARLRGALRHATDAILAWPRKRRAMAQLSALSDRELADIGLTRGDLARVIEVDTQAAPLPQAANDLIQATRAA